MPCDTVRQRSQTFSERASEVRRAVAKLDQLIVSRRVIPRVGSQGAIAFAQWSEIDKDGVTDVCAYRRIMATGSALARAAIARAEAMAGRTVDRQVIGQGVHSHDGGATWHPKG
jgi:hypothetical protein